MRSRCARASLACRPRSWSQGAPCWKAQRIGRQSSKSAATPSERGSSGDTTALSATEARREAAEALPRRERKDELRRIDSMESASRRQLSRLEVEMQETPAPGRCSAAGVRRRGSSPRRAAAVGDYRCPPLPAHLHHEGAGGEAHRSGEAEGMGSRCRRDRELPPGARHQGHEQGVWSRGETRSRASAPAGRNATAARDSASPGPRAARGASAPARQRIEHRSMSAPTYRD